jgi:hypothetical protein
MTLLLSKHDVRIDDDDGDDDDDDDDDDKLRWQRCLSDASCRG